MNHDRHNRLLAAADKVELIPPPGGRLGGFGCRFEPHQGSLDKLHARILLLEKDDTRVAWVACDLLGFSTALDRAFRQQLAGALAISSEHVLISCTHTHSAPVAMPARGPSGIADERWLRQGVFERVAQRAAALAERMQPVAKLKAGTRVILDLGYNRQDPDHPIDERLLSACLVGADGRPIATLVNYALHPVIIGERNLKCSADYPGYVCSTIESQLGGVALFVQGSCGDVDPRLYRDEGRHAGTASHIREIGARLGEAAIEALSSASGAAADLRIETRRITLPLDSPPLPNELADLQARLGRQRGRDVIYQQVWAQELADAIQRGTVPDQLTADVSALRIGPLYVLAFPFEIYSEIGLELRKRLAPRDLMIAAYTHGLIGYVVTAAARQQGGYGPALSHRYFPELLTPIGAGADERLIECGVSLVRALEKQETCIRPGV